MRASASLRSVALDTTFATLAMALALPSSAASQSHAAADSVIVAPGVRAAATSVGASRAIVDSNDARSAAALTFSELMQARAASVDVMMSGGRLVDGGHFLVRGPATLITDGAPIVVVDGMRMAEQEDDFGSTGSRLDDIAVADIARVEVLRGPSASALFGAGASAGVIVVTTKRGAAGPLRSRVRAFSDGRRDAGNYSDRYRRLATGSATSFSCPLSNAAQRFCVPGTLERWNPLAEAGVFRLGFGGGASADVSGGTRAHDARLSVTARHASGITKGDQLTQLTSRLNATQRVGSWLEMTGRASYYGNKTDGSVVGEVIDGVPYNSIGATPIETFTRWADAKLSQPSIVGRLDHVTTGADIAVRPTAWLTLRGAATRDYVNEHAERVISFPSSSNTDSRYIQDALGDSRLLDVAKRGSGWNTHRAFRATGELRIPLPNALRTGATLIAGSERELRRRYQKAQDGGLTVEALREFTNDATFALARFAIADAFAINAGVRNEKDSGADRNWSAYPTANAALRVRLPAIGADLRLRAAYGESSQRYAMSSSYAPENPVPEVSIGGFPLPPARALPERMKEREGGLDVDWGDAGALSVTGYHRAVTNVSYATAAPFGATIVGALDMMSSGVEVDARVALIRRNDLRWSVRGIVATNDNHPTSDVEYPTFPAAGLVTGHPIGVAQRRPYTFNDANANGVIDFGEVTTSNVIERAGGVAPTLSAALHSELRLGRRLTLTGVVDRRSGAWTQSGYAKTLCALPELACAALQDPAATFAEQASGMVNSAYAGPLPVFFDASFTRLRELGLRWTLRPAPARSARAYGMSMFLAGRDLATWTQWPGTDPEISSMRRGALTRNDATALPLPRRITLGVELDY